MKTNILTLALISLSLSLYSQNVDLFGIPTSIHKKEIQHISIQRTSSVPEEANVVDAFSCPVNFSTGLAFDGTLLWISGYAEYNLYGINPVTGEVLDTLPISIKRPYGLTYKDGIFYMVNNDVANGIRQILEIDRYTGELLCTHELTWSSNSYPTGVEIVNGQIWYNDPRGPYASSSTDDVTVKYNCGTDSCQAFSIDADYPSALAYDGNSLWIVDNSSQLIHKVNKLNFASEKTIHAPGGQYPNGLAFDGQYMWISNNDSDTIYKIDLGNTSTNVENTNFSEYVKVYPSISNHTFHIDLGNLQAEHVKIEFVGIDGRTISSMERVTQQKLSWTIPNQLAEGMYFFKIEFRNQILTKKVFVKK